MSEAPWGHSRRKPVLYRLVRALTIVVVLSGVVVGLHRNDLLREGARRIGRETQYLELERRLVGAPGYGTPRSVEANLHAPAASPPAPAAAPVALAEEPSSLSARAPASEAAAAAPSPASVVPSAPAATEPPPAEKSEPAPVAAVPAPEPIDPLKPISLDQLPVLRSGQSAKTAAPPAAPTESAPRAAAKVQVFDMDPPKAKASKPKVDRAEKAASVPKPAPKAKEPDPTAPRAGDNPLKAAIRDAMRKQNAK